MNGRICRKADSNALACNLINMLGDPGKLRDMGKISREIARNKFDWEIITGKTRDFYSRAIPEFYARL